MHITVNDLSFSYDAAAPVLSGVSFSVSRGERWAIIGKNGAGKSTLIRCISGLESTKRGAIRIRDRDLTDLHPRELARMVAYVPQAQGRMVPYTVLDYVMMGRFPYQGFLALASSADRTIVDDALKLTDTTHLRDRPMSTLSGGEQQRVFLAGAVSQQTEILLLDEPSTFLDPQHQALVEQALKRIHDELNVTMLTVTHDVNSALSNSENALALVDHGRVLYAGPSANLLEEPEMLEEIYGVAFESGVMGRTGRRIVAVVGEYEER